MKKDKNDRGGRKALLIKYKEEIMEYKDIRENLEEMMNDNYKDFIKAIVSIEKGINDEKALEEVYVLYMNNDTTGLLSDDFVYD